MFDAQFSSCGLLQKCSVDGRISGNFASVAFGAAVEKKWTMAAGPETCEWGLIKCGQKVEIT